jgi:hypothetical protein
MDKMAAQATLHENFESSISLFDEIALLKKMKNLVVGKK